SNTATVAVTVTPVNDAPVAIDGTLAATEDVVATSILAATDVDSSVLLFSLFTQAVHGVVAITNPTTGAYTYTPAANYNGPDSFTFTASDRIEISNAGTISVMVTPVNDAPGALDRTLAATEDVVASGLLAATDGDGDALTFSIV